MADSPISDREYLLRVMDERNAQYIARFQAAEVAVAAALAAQEKSVTAAFSASEKAIVKAETAQSEYNARSNEFRGQLDDQAKTLMPRTETQVIMDGMEDKLNSVITIYDGKLDAMREGSTKTLDGMRSELSIMQQQIAGLLGRINGMGIIIVLVSLALQVVFFLITHK